MKHLNLTAIAAGVLLATSISVSASSGNLSTRVGDVEFDSGYPTQETMKKMINEMDFQRATQAFMWGIPLSGVMEFMNAARNDFGLQEGQFSYFFTRAQKQGIITSNFTTPYIIGAWNLDISGPTVVELPEARMAGMLLDVHQRVLSDLSLLDHYSLILT
jgi:hypothetical protein